MSPTTLRTGPGVTVEIDADPAMEWKEYLESYPPGHQSELRFATRDEALQAIDLLWESALRACPHSFSPAGGIVVPTTAVPLFKQSGIRFREFRPSFY